MIWLMIGMTLVAGPYKDWGYCKADEEILRHRLPEIACAWRA